MNYSTNHDHNLHICSMELKEWNMILSKKTLFWSQEPVTYIIDL